MSTYLRGAASRGTGPEQYSIRLPVWLAENVRLKELETVDIGQSVRFRIAGRDADIERRESFLIFWIRGFDTESEARTFLDRVALGLVRLAEQKTAAIQFCHTVGDISVGT